MRLEDCTKAELIKVIKRIKSIAPNGEFWVERTLIDLESDRERKKLAEAENWGKIADDARTQYCEFLKKYEGMKLIDIPIDEVKRAQELLEIANRADKKYLELSKIG